MFKLVSIYRMMAALILLGISLLLTGCGTTSEHINWYQGQMRATNEIGLIKFWRSFPYDGPNVFVFSIDGTNISKGFTVNNTKEVELLPGMHTLGLRFICEFQDDIMSSVSNCLISFNCESGHVYDAYMSPFPTGKEFWNKIGFWGGRFYLTAWIVDEQTEEVVAGRRFTKYFFTTSGLTSLGNVQKEQRGHRTTLPTFAPQDVIIFDVEVPVDDPVKKLDMRNVVVRWYAGSSFISDPSNEQYSLSFDGTNNKLHLQRKASTLGIGHFKVIVLIEGEEVASQEFDVAP
jgi:hypothetical protein